MQIRCSKKGCKNHEKCSKMHPKWEPKSTQILKKTRFKNVLVFGINFRRPQVPILLAKWSPTRRTSSRKPNRKGNLQEGNSQDSLRIPTRPRRGGGAPGPERTFEYRRALWPSKNALWEGVWKNMKIAWKIDAKIEGFWWLRTTFGVILFAYFTLLPFSKNIEKSMQKGMPKVVVFDPKTDLGRPRVDWLCHFGRFLRIRKSLFFLLRLVNSKN